MPVLPRENSSTTTVVLEFSCGGTGVWLRDDVRRTADGRPDTTASALFLSRLSYPNNEEDNKQRLEFTARMVYDYATTAPLEELEWLRDTVEYNTAASQCGLSGMGLHTGEILMEQARGDMVHTVVARTVAASEAVMVTA